MMWKRVYKLIFGLLCRGQYSNAVLDELESQNDGQVEGIMGKVRLLKDVCSPLSHAPGPTYRVLSLHSIVTIYLPQADFHEIDDSSNRR